jgi:phosphoribosylformylglycinamidine synthase subunit PurQ / glutaminase
MKFGVVVFPGSNCDEDMFYCLSQNMGQEVVKLWHKQQSLEGVDVVVLPGGFSYGDYLRSGAIARFSPIMNEVIAHANKGGLVFGICNGFQILTEAGLLPGALLHNLGQKFICQNVFIKPEHTESTFSRAFHSKAYKIPIAHGEGRYFASDSVLDEIESNNQVLFRYCDENAVVSPSANINGSERNIAGVVNKAGNVFGMMPHPERAADSILGNTDGVAFFQSVIGILEAV